MAPDDALNQDEIDKLLSQGGGAQAEGESGQKEEKKADDSAPLDQAEIEALLSGASKSDSQEKSDSQQAPAGGAVDVPDADKLLQQDDIDKLLEQARGKTQQTAPKQQQAATAATPTEEPAETIQQADIEFLLRQAQEALNSIDQPASQIPESAQPFSLEEFSPAPPSTDTASLELISDVELDVQVELGRTEMSLEDVLRLRKGSVVALNKLAGDPVDIYVNGRLVARGEVLVLNDNFCIRVGELVAGIGGREEEEH